MASSSGAFKSREEWKAAKELEEARKAGTAPPAVDDEGRIINPHIPEYISQAPWYLAQDGPGLKHQRSQQAGKRKHAALGKWLPRGEVAGPAATKYRKGACENCGVMTHTKRNCLERPRRRGAKFTGVDIRADEVVGSVELDFQGKHDRWNGFDDQRGQKEVQERYARVDAERKALKAKKLDSELRSGGGARKASSDSDDSDDSDEERDDASAQKGGKDSMTSARNLRIREDTAKYLYNLNVDSAYYDPKSRAMRADPNPDGEPEDKDYAGDNFVRYTGEVTRLAQMEAHTTGANERGRNLPHVQAEPSRAEALFKEFEGKKKELEERRNREILEKYGGQKHSKRDAAIEGVNQTQAYVEYSRDGRAIKSSKQVIPASRYPEDVLEKSHTAIWGSFYKNGMWGYGCCHQTQRNAMCTGEEGKRAAIETEQEMEERTKEAIAKRDPKPLAQQWAEKRQEKEKNALPVQEAARKERVEQREVEEEMRKQQAEEERMEQNDRGRRYNSGFREDEEDGKMSEAALEAHRLRRQLRDDPMAKYLADKR